MKSRLWFFSASLGAVVALAALLPVFHPGHGVDEAAAEGIEMSLDVDISDGGPCASIDSEITVAPGEGFQVGICLRNVPQEIAAFQLKVIYDDTIVNAPELPAEDGALDDNPDANAGVTMWGEGLGENWSCDILGLGQQPVGDNDPATGPGHGLTEMACWTLIGPSPIGNTVDEGVLAVISFQGDPSHEGTTTLELAEVVVGTSQTTEVGSCNPTVSMEMDCNGATVHVKGETIAPEERLTATPAEGEIERPVLPDGSPRVSPAPGEEEETPEETVGAEPGDETEEDGDSDWLWPVVIGVVVAVVVVGLLALAFYLRRRGRAS